MIFTTLSSLNSSNVGRAMQNPEHNREKTSQIFSMFGDRDRRRTGPIAKLSLVLFSSLGLLTACTESKVTQCNRLVAEVNKGQEISQNIKGTDAEAMKKLSTDLGGLSQTIAAVPLKDETLVGYRDRFAQVYKDLGGAAATVGGALETLKALKGKAAIAKAKEIQQQAIAATQTSAQAIKEESTLIKEVNDYCGATAGK